MINFIYENKNECAYGGLVALTTTFAAAALFSASTLVALFCGAAAGFTTAILADKVIGGTGFDQHF